MAGKENGGPCSLFVVTLHTIPISARYFRVSLLVQQMWTPPVAVRGHRILPSKEHLRSIDYHTQESYKGSRESTTYKRYTIRSTRTPRTKRAWNLNKTRRSSWYKLLIDSIVVPLPGRGLLLVRLAPPVMLFSHAFLQKTHTTSHSTKPRYEARSLLTCAGCAKIETKSDPQSYAKQRHNHASVAAKRRWAPSLTTSIASPQHGSVNRWAFQGRLAA